MRRFILSLSLVLLGLIGYSQITEDKTISVTPDPVSGIIYFSSPDKIDSVEIRGILDEIVFSQKVDNQREFNANSVPRNYYYIAFITAKGETRIQKLFFK